MVLCDIEVLCPRSILSWITFLDVLMITVGHLHRILWVREGSTEKMNITTRKYFSTLKDTLSAFAEDLCGFGWGFFWVCLFVFGGVVSAFFCWVEVG